MTGTAFPGRSATTGAANLWFGLATAAILLVSIALYRAWPGGSDGLERLVLVYSTLPRGAVALLGGAALGLSGALLQRTLRNPIADPSTLGILSGAQLALTLATVYAPVLLEVAREPIAFAGGSAALLLVLALSLRGGLEPVTVILSGLLVSMIAGAFSATIILANGEYMMSLFIWGGGSLEQQSWGPSASLALRLVLAAVAVALLSRPLRILALDDGSARSIGLAVTAMRVTVLLVAVFLAASVTAEVGIIGFVGLAAPNLARLFGARSAREMMIAAPIVGALLLLLTDQIVQSISFGGRELMPTGAATALIGGPILLWLLPRLKAPLAPPAANLSSGARSRHPRRTLALLAGLTALLIVCALFLGRDGNGWFVASGASLEALLPWRWPRVVAGAAAGAMLAAAGVVLQRVSGNAMASPEVLGVSAGAGVGLAAVLLVFGSASRGLELAGTTAGALVALTLVLVVAARHRFGPERLLLAGIAVGALAGALVTSVTARGGPEAMQLLDWAAGSSARVTPTDAVLAVVAAVVLIAPLPFLTRWLGLLPLGVALPRALGLNRDRAAGLLVLLAALLSAVSTLLVGPLSFVGLMAPHLARLAGFARPGPQLSAAVLLGALLMVFADWMARTLTFPYQLPIGLFASLVGGPYLVWVLNRRSGRP